MRKSICIILLLLISGLACETTDGLTPGVSLEDLVDAPVSLSIGGRSFFLETYLWRDFMPVSPPDGKPLIAVVRIVAADSLALSPGLECHRIYVILNDEMWEADATLSETQPEDFKLECVARDGPKWGPNVAVEVVVRLYQEDTYYYLRAPQQWIFRTD